MYNETNHIHYDFFDYIDDDGKKHQYEPDSDMEFTKFKKLMKDEWTNRPQSFVSSITKTLCTCGCF